jgi:hypothetical protein
MAILQYGHIIRHVTFDHSWHKVIETIRTKHNVAFS